jgi:hypothetical protein
MSITLISVDSELKEELSPIVLNTMKSSRS